MRYTVTYDVTSSQPDDPPSPRDTYLDAARDCILDVGWRRTTLTEVARRAGVSRMTIYRTWADMPQLLSDLMTREWGRRRRRRPRRGGPGHPDRRAPGRRHRRHRPAAARQRALPPDRRPRPRADPPLPLLPARPLAGRDPRAHRRRAARGPGRGRGARRQPGADGAGDAARRPRLRALGAHDGRRRRLPRRPRRRAPPGADPGAAAMSAATRITPGLAGAPTDVDVVVIGLGITGTGVALDAVTRGLSVLAVDAHDLAFGTSRWSSKLVHGGLRYLAKLQFGVAHESAVERGILMERTAPHLTHPLSMLIPLGSVTSRRLAVLTGAGLVGGDVLRRAAGTSSDAPAHAAPHPRGRGAPARPAPDRRAPRRAGHLGRPARGRRPPGHQRRAHGRVVRRPRPHPGPRADRHRHLGRAPRRADRRDHDRHRPDRHQRHRGLGRRPGPRGDAAPEPRHPPGAARVEHPGPAHRGVRPIPGTTRPVHQRAAPARRHDLHRPHRRARRRRRSPTCPSRPSPRSASCSTSRRRRSRRRCTAAT